MVLEEIRRLHQEQQQAISNIKKNIKSQFNPFIEYRSDKEVPQDWSSHKRIKPDFWNNELWPLIKDHIESRNPFMSSWVDNLKEAFAYDPAQVREALRAKFDDLTKDLTSAAGMLKILNSKLERELAQYLTYIRPELVYLLLEGAKPSGVILGEDPFIRDFVELSRKQQDRKYLFEQLNSLHAGSGNGEVLVAKNLTGIWKYGSPPLLDELLSLSQEINNLEKDEDSNRYVWNNESWKDLVVITERWKKEGFLIPTYSKYEAQTDLCRIVCNEFVLPSSGKKFNSICKAFNKSTILLNNDNLELEPKIKDSLQSLNARINIQH